MSIGLQNLEVKNNRAASRFEVQLGDKLAVIDYHDDGYIYVLLHVEVPPEYRGRGIADQMTQVALETAKTEKHEVMPICSFVRAYIQRHPEYKPLVASNAYQR